MAAWRSAATAAAGAAAATAAGALLFLLLTTASPRLAAAAQDSASASLQSVTGPPEQCTPDVIRRIPWGVGIGALQFEGLGSGGRAPSVWEAWIVKDPSVIQDRTDTSLGADFFRRYQSDIDLLKRLKVKHLRIALSWPRLIPGAKKGSAVNPEAVKYYGGLLDALLAAGIQPLVALYHCESVGCALAFLVCLGRGTSFRDAAGASTLDPADPTLNSRANRSHLHPLPTPRGPPPSAAR